MSYKLTKRTQWCYLKTELCENVGIDTLQEQIRKKALKQGSEFNIMAVGRSGLGKSTLLNTLFKAFISRKSCSKEEKRPDSHNYRQTTEIKTATHLLEENSVRLRLTLTDTPGFGDQINNINCWFPIQEYILDQFEKYLAEEQATTRKKYITDTRVHCCLYFIPPLGHWLTPLDIEFMKRLHKIVNIIPVIAKSDTMTFKEITVYKAVIKECLAENGITIYPMNEIREDSPWNNKIRDLIPFAIVGSEKQHNVKGKMVYGRETRWGVLEIENEYHCEFSHLKDMLIRTHRKDLIEVTKFLHYEKFRQKKLKGEMLKDVLQPHFPDVKVNKYVKDIKPSWKEPEKAKPVTKAIIGRLPPINSCITASRPIKGSHLAPLPPIKSRIASFPAIGDSHIAPLPPIKAFPVGPLVTSHRTSLAPAAFSKVLDRTPSEGAIEQPATGRSSLLDRVIPSKKSPLQNIPTDLFSKLAISEESHGEEELSVTTFPPVSTAAPVIPSLPSASVAADKTLQVAATTQPPSAAQQEEH